MSKAKYIVIEGIDGSGKTTQYQRLLEYLGPQTVGVREPGGTPMSEAIRTLLKDREIPRAPHTNMFLFSAARTDLVDTVIRPTIQGGQHVLSDRNWLSTAAYQSAEGADVEQITQLSKLAAQEFFEPDLLLLIDVDPVACYKRLHSRGGSQADFFEAKGTSYFIKVRQAYLDNIQTLSHAVVIDGSLPIEEVWQSVKQAIIAAGIEKEGV